MLQPNFTPFPELSTERLLLRKITMEDIQDIFFLRSDTTIYQFLGKEPATDLKQAEEFIALVTKNIENNDSIIWAIVLKEAPSKVIGTICFWNMQKEHYRTEIGYALDPAQWRKGIMKEAILKVLDYGFEEIGLHSVEARLSAANTASAAVLESTGFVKEAYFKEDFFHRGKFEDTLVYSRLKQ
jgi:[ribosomal protein S5]-alanine N-acetyltransferase